MNANNSLFCAKTGYKKYEISHKTCHIQQLYAALLGPEAATKGGKQF